MFSTTATMSCKRVQTCAETSDAIAVHRHLVAQPFSRPRDDKNTAPWLTTAVYQDCAQRRRFLFFVQVQNFRSVWLRYNGFKSPSMIILATAHLPVWNSARSGTSSTLGGKKGLWHNSSPHAPTWSP